MTEQDVEMKRCGRREKCVHPESDGRGWLPATPSYFSRNRNAKDGLVHNCKACFIDWRNQKKSNPDYKVSKADEIPGMKRCGRREKCVHPESDGQGWLPSTLIYFGPDERRKYGLGSNCRECRHVIVKKYDDTHKDESKKWRDDNKESLKLYNKNYREQNWDALAYKKSQWQKSNRDKCNAISRRWRLAHKGDPKIKEGWTRYYWKNRLRCIAQVRKYQQTHPETMIASQNRRRARILGNGGSFTTKEWRSLCEKYNYTCLCCGANDVKMSPDHVIPLVLGGSNDISNIQPLCKTCNFRKGGKYIDYRPVSDD